jgi:hypothetical protein
MIFLQLIILIILIQVPFLTIDVKEDFAPIAEKHWVLELVAGPGTETGTR